MTTGLTVPGMGTTRQRVPPSLITDLDDALRLHLAL